MNIAAYTILHAESVTDMVNKVRAYLSGGWQPLGGVQVIQENGKTTYVQTVVQYSV